MKNFNFIFNGVLFIAVVVLYVLHFTAKNEVEDPGQIALVGKTIKVNRLPIAYVNVDSLLLNYGFAKELNEALLRKQESSRAQLTEKGKALQAEMADFQKKVENNGFLSRERAESEQRRLMGKQQELQQLEQRMSGELVKQQQSMNERLRDTINSFLKEYNKDKKYHMILSNTMFDNVLYADQSYNITKDVIAKLNERYKTTK